MVKGEWRMDAYVKCPNCGSENDGAALFGDAPESLDDGEPFGVFDGLESVSEEPCWGCGVRMRIRLERING